ncbi:MFS transporter [Thermomonospora umbrina]|uniref:Putative MFS family arabinose efflux permease n=1 Tax=Thermomonospora umbrina TaxID=111806 RepID=A0A3D9SJ19_9ACTN|nr:MFS transporter [Thermomonospora umbrina]REE95912.1 putative MFS family arabinose efflux permease [Thermomonospora umbrina]
MALGGAFGRLWTAGTISGLGDGVTQIAGALLAVSLTRDPISVSGVMVAQLLPWLLFGLPGGVLVDRLDRRRLMIAACVVRVAALAPLGLAVAADRASLPLLYGVFFLVGCAGLLFDGASATAVPALVAPERLEQANGRLQATKVVCEQLVSRPLGGGLFVLAAWAPFVVDAGALLSVIALVLTLPALDRTSDTAARPVGLRTAIADGARWLRDHRLLRTVTLTVGLSNVGLGSVFSVMVLVAHERLGLGAVGYGLLLATAAVGGVAGGMLTGRIVAALGPGTTLRLGLLLEMAAYAGLASTRDVLVAVLILLPFTAHLAVFSAVGASLRQTLVPADLLGRVHAAYRLVGTAGMFLGAVLGGLLAERFGLAAPFWLGLGCAAVFTTGAWRRLNDRDIRAAREGVGG